VLSIKRQRVLFWTIFQVCHVFAAYDTRAPQEEEMKEALSMKNTNDQNQVLSRYQGTGAMLEFLGEIHTPLVNSIAKSENGLKGTSTQTPSPSNSLSSR